MLHIHSDMTKVYIDFGQRKLKSFSVITDQKSEPGFNALSKVKVHPIKSKVIL